MSNYIGVCHIHSTHSSDGDLTIAEIARFFRERRYHFVCLTEHSSKPDGSFIGEDKMKEMREECRAASSDSFVVIPGLECETDSGVHILAIGVTQPIESRNYLEVIDAIKLQGGIAVLAHPFFFERKYPQELMEQLDGIEIWNGGKVPVPDASACFMLQKLHRKGITPLAYFGLDFHRQEQYKPLCMIVSADELSVSGVVQALKSGNYLLRSPEYEITPFADFPKHKLIQWYLYERFFFSSRRWAVKLKNKLDEKGIKIPEKATAAIRRFYFN